MNEETSHENLPKGSAEGRGGRQHNAAPGQRGQAPHFITSFLDITGRKRAESELIEQLEELQRCTHHLCVQRH